MLLPCATYVSNNSTPIDRTYSTYYYSSWSRAPVLSCVYGRAPSGLTSCHLPSFARRAPRRRRAILFLFLFRRSRVSRRTRRGSEPVGPRDGAVGSPFPRRPRLHSERVRVRGAHELGELGVLADVIRARDERGVRRESRPARVRSVKRKRRARPLRGARGGFADARSPRRASSRPRVPPESVLRAFFPHALRVRRRLVRLARRVSRNVRERPEPERPGSKVPASF